MLYALFAFVLIAVPHRVAGVLPDIIGAVMLVYAVVNLIVFYAVPDSDTEVGDSVLAAAVGLVLLLQGEHSVVTMGVIWAVFSLQETAAEMNVTFREKSYTPRNIVGYLFTIILAVLLMFDPFEHFHTHIRILGVEMLFSVIVRRLRLFDKEKKEKE